MVSFMPSKTSSSFYIQLEDISEYNVDSTGRVSYGGNYAEESFRVAVVGSKDLDDLEIIEILSVEADDRGRITVGKKYADEEVFLAKYRKD